MIGLLTPAVVGSLLLAILSTVADYVWFLNIPQHQVASGAIHGLDAGSFRVKANELRARKQPDDKPAWRSVDQDSAVGELLRCGG